MRVLVVVPALLWSLALLVSPLALRGATSESGEFQLDHFTTAEGLLANHITALALTDEGTLWIGTTQGVCSFDGHDIEYHPHPELDGEEVLALSAFQEAVVALFAKGLYQIGPTPQLLAPLNLSASGGGVAPPQLHLDSLGQLWLATNDGVSLLQGSSGQQRWMTWDQLPKTRVLDWFSSPASPEVWVSFRGEGLGRYHLKTNEWTLYPPQSGGPSAYVNDMDYHPLLGMLFATHEGLWQFNEERFAQITGLLGTSMMLQIAKDADHSLWLTRPNQGLDRWTPGPEDLLGAPAPSFQISQVTHYQKDLGLTTNLIHDIAQLEDQHLLFLTPNGVFQQVNRSWRLLDEAAGLLSNQITAIAGASATSFWLGSRRGLTRVEVPKLQTFLKDRNRFIPTAGSQHHRIFPHPVGALYFPSHLGLARWEAQQFSLLNEGLSQPEIMSVAFFQGQIYVMTPSEIARLRGDTFENLWSTSEAAPRQLVVDHQETAFLLTADYALLSFSEAKGSTEVRTLMTLTQPAVLVRDKHGVVWLSTGQRLSRLTGEPLTVRALEQVDRGLDQPTPLLHTSFDQEGHWWFLSDQQLVLWTETRQSRWALPPRGPQQTFTEVISALPGQSFLLGTERSQAGNKLLFYFDGETFWPLSGSVPHADEGRSFRVFTSTNRDLWISSHRGLWRFHPAGTPRFSPYTIKDGLAGNQVNTMAWDKKGGQWIATNGGITTLQGELTTQFSIVDGLLDPDITDLAFDGEGHLWTRSRGGVQQFHPDPIPPQVVIKKMMARDRPLPLTEKTFSLSSRDTPLSIHLGVKSPVAATTQLQYRYTLTDGGKNISQAVTRDTTLLFPNLRPSVYQLTLQAFNRDLRPSPQITSLSFLVRPPWWKQPMTLLLTAIVSVLLVGFWIRMRTRKKLEQTRLTSELQTAHRMQMELMPPFDPQFEGIDVAGYCEPTREVGGDFFDYFFSDSLQNRLSFSIFDVSGKSMEAAMVAVMGAGLIQAEAHRGHTPASILARMNVPLFQKTRRRVFVTGLVAELDRHSLTLSWSSAGHGCPLLFREGEPLTVPQTFPKDLPLGFRREVHYRHFEVTLKPGDLILLVTDGITEAMNEQRDLFGEERLFHVIARHFDLPCKDLLQTILQHVQEFSGGTGAQDDQTLVLVRVPHSTPPGS
jgi:serine phosphatase RsbU (regulator of sigma subunit)/ligand-binding sensor domain-containing protein